MQSHCRRNGSLLQAMATKKQEQQYRAWPDVKHGEVSTRGGERYRRGLEDKSQEECLLLRVRKVVLLSQHTYSGYLRCKYLQYRQLLIVPGATGLFGESRFTCPMPTLVPLLFAKSPELMTTILETKVRVSSKEKRTKTPRAQEEITPVFIKDEVNKCTMWGHFLTL